MTLLEQIARFLHDGSDMPLFGARPFEDLSRQERADLIQRAKALLLLIRTPSQAMYEAGAKELARKGGPGSHPIKRVWPVMIDELINSGGGHGAG